MAAGRDPDDRVAIVSNATLPHQSVHRLPRSASSDALCARPPSRPRPSSCSARSASIATGSTGMSAGPQGDRFWLAPPARSACHRRARAPVPARRSSALGLCRGALADRGIAVAPGQDRPGLYRPAVPRPRRAGAMPQSRSLGDGPRRGCGALAAAHAGASRPAARRGRDGPVRRRRRRRRLDRRSRRQARPAGGAGRRLRPARPVGRARWSRALPASAPTSALPASSSTASPPTGTRPCCAMRSTRAASPVSAPSAPIRTSSCPTAISASSSPTRSPASTRSSTRAAAAVALGIDLDGLLACRGPARCPRRQRPALAAARPAHRHRPRRRLRLSLSPLARRLARCRCRAQLLLAARRRGARRRSPTRCSCPAAIRNCMARASPPRRASRPGLSPPRDRGALIYGECGGYMVLGESLTDKPRRRPIAWPAFCRMPAASTGRNRILGYRRPAPPGAAALRRRACSGHEFHYSSRRAARADAQLFAATDAAGASAAAHGRRRSARSGLLCPCHRRGYEAGAMTARALMFMGTGSDVGKSLIVAGLCRAYRQSRAAGRAVQAAEHVQQCRRDRRWRRDRPGPGPAGARRRRAPLTAMNPVLLKPEAETGAQVIVRGQRIGSLSARDYLRERGRLLPEVLSAFAELAGRRRPRPRRRRRQRLRGQSAGTTISPISASPAPSASPVVLIGDIERGGVIASLVGTFAVIDPADAGLIAATLINQLPRRSGPVRRRTCASSPNAPDVPVPRADARSSPTPTKLPAEDALALERAPRHAARADFRIVVPRLPRIANFDDLDPLRAEPGVSVVHRASRARRCRATPISIILPGSKATRADLAALRARRLGHRHRCPSPRRRRACSASAAATRCWAGPSPIPTASKARRARATASACSTSTTVLDAGQAVARRTRPRMRPAARRSAGYHMHMGETAGPDRARPFARIGDKARRAPLAADGLVMGTYLHGLFAADGFRRAFLAASAPASTPASPTRRTSRRRSTPRRASRAPSRPRRAARAGAHAALGAADDASSPPCSPSVSSASSAIRRAAQARIGHPVDLDRQAVIDLARQRASTLAPNAGRGSAGSPASCARRRARRRRPSPRRLVAAGRSGLPFGFVLEALLASTLLARRSSDGPSRAVADGLRRRSRRGQAALQPHRRPRRRERSTRPAWPAPPSRAWPKTPPTGWSRRCSGCCSVGLPGIALYKAINTADSMIGHLTRPPSPSSAGPAPGSTTSSTWCRRG